MPKYKLREKGYVHLSLLEKDTILELPKEEGDKYCDKPGKDGALEYVGWMEPVPDAAQPETEEGRVGTQKARAAKQLIDRST